MNRKQFLHSAPLGVGALALGGPVAALVEGSTGAQEARRVLHFALACAEQAGNWHLRATPSTPSRP